MNWTEKQHGNIKLIHYSTASLIQIVITGDCESKEEIFLTYEEFDDLREVMKEIDNT